MHGLEPNNLDSSRMLLHVHDVFASSIGIRLGCLVLRSAASEGMGVLPGAAPGSARYEFCDSQLQQQARGSAGLFLASNGDNPAV